MCVCIPMMVDNIKYIYIFIYTYMLLFHHIPIYILIYIYRYVFFASLQHCIPLRSSSLYPTSPHDC